MIRRVFEHGAYADRVFHAEAPSLNSPRDRALAMTLAYGTIQRRRTLDHILAGLSSRCPEKLDPPILAALRLGLFQLVFLDGIADHAAVHESVELAKQESHGGATLVNAVLRRAVREGPRLTEHLDDDTPESAAIMHSVPDWIAEMWWRELGPEEARPLLTHINQPAEAALRINTLKAKDGVDLPVPSHPAPELPEGRVLEASFDVFGSTAFNEGLITPQSRASMLVARTLAPQPGERVLDLCAAPGAKTTHLAALMGNLGKLTAVEVHPGRAKTLKKTCERMGASCVTVSNQDGRHPTSEPPYDRVLVDPPCSGLGTLQSRPDLRWQPQRAHVDELAGKQLQLLSAGGAQLKPGGTLVYSVCTISQAESEEVIQRFLTDHADFRLDSARQLLPHKDGTDGFFIARLKRD